MNILIAPDKFKDSLSAQKVCDSIENSIINILPDSKVIKLPLADGGEGSLEVLETNLELNRKYIEVNNPLFKPIKTFYAIKNSSAYIEMAKASGLQLLAEHERNPMYTSSFGTGELILDAIKNGNSSINLFVGGSATNDAGIGIASALVYKFNDENNNELIPIGENLIKIRSIDSSSIIPLKGIKINVLTDVRNPLLGKDGAASIYAEQKGANEEEISELDKGLGNIANLIYSSFGIDVSKIPGGGAAGGIGAGTVAFCNAEISSGLDTILNLLNIDDHIKEYDLVITGEGKLDSQSSNGKVVGGVIFRSRKLKKSFGIICGTNELTQIEENNYFPAIIKPIKTDEISKEDAIINVEKYLIERTKEVIEDYLKYFV